MQLQIGGGPCGAHHGMPSDRQGRLVEGARNVRGRSLGNEVNAPEVRAGREEFDSDARSLVRGFADVDDAAFLLLLGRGVDQDDFRADFQLLLEVEQAALHVDYNGVAAFAEFAAFPVGSLGPHREAGDQARAAALRVGGSDGHDKAMV